MVLEGLVMDHIALLGKARSDRVCLVRTNRMCRAWFTSAVPLTSRHGQRRTREHGKPPAQSDPWEQTPSQSSD